MRKRSSRSAGIVWLDREERIGALRAAARKLASALAEVRRVILFGSLARDGAGPRSDADLLVVVSSSPHAEPRHRVPEVLTLLGSLPCPVDLFVVTEEELERSRDFGLARIALAEGVDLLSA